jgi:hypothetical protein
MVTVKAIQQTEDVILYRGRPFVRQETDTEVKLISLNRGKDGRKTVLVFTKDVELSNQTAQVVSNMIRKSIISNYLKGNN